MKWEGKRKGVLFYITSHAHKGMHIITILTPIVLHCALELHFLK